MTRIIRMVTVAAVLGLGTLSVGGASAKGFGGGHFGGGFGHGHGDFGGGHGHWGGHGHGYWGGYGFAPVSYGGCRLQRYVDVYGDLVVRRICF